MAVVTEVALERGRFAALLTVAGVNIANSSLALTSMLGLSALLHQWPSLLRAVSTGGAIYLTYLGIRALWHAMQGRGRIATGSARMKSAKEPSAVVRGILTNFLNPSVVLFYMLLLPGSSAGTDPFFRRFLLLATTHVSMSVVWLSAYAIAVGSLSERMESLWVRRTMEIATGLILVILGVKLILK